MTYTLQMLLLQQELLSELINGEDEKNCMKRLYRLVVHLFMWVACLASISFGAMVVHYLSEVRKNCCAARHEILHAQMTSYRKLCRNRQPQK